MRKALRLVAGQTDGAGQVAALVVGQAEQGSAETRMMASGDVRATSSMSMPPMALTMMVTRLGRAVEDGAQVVLADHGDHLSDQHLADRPALERRPQDGRGRLPGFGGSGRPLDAPGLAPPPDQHLGLHHHGPPSSRAMASASSAVSATLAGGNGTP